MLAQSNRSEEEICYIISDLITDMTELIDGAYHKYKKALHYKMCNNKEYAMSSLTEAKTMIEQAAIKETKLKSLFVDRKMNPVEMALYAPHYEWGVKVKHKIHNLSM